MRALRIGSHGPAVTELQAKLKTYVPDVVGDGMFGPRTDRAVRLAQRRLGLFPPDGIAGPQTMAALTKAGTAKSVDASAMLASGGLLNRIGAATRQAEADLSRWVQQHVTGAATVPPTIRQPVAPAMKRAKSGPMPPGIATPVGGMRMSPKGRLFIIRHEGQHGVSNHLHHPSFGSGVTLGPGYDMKDRSRAQVAGDLKSVFGVDPAVAGRVAEGAGLQGNAAAAFVRKNKQLIDLSETQQAALLANIIGHYEGMVREAIRIPLQQYEFNALVSYAYNPGGGWRKATKLINQHDPSGAAVELSKHVTSKGQRIQSLVVRRHAETRMLLYGEYR